MLFLNWTSVHTKIK